MNLVNFLYYTSFEPRELVGSELLETHSYWPSYFDFGFAVSFERLGVTAKNSLVRAWTLIEVANQSFIPVLSEAHVRINLQVEVFIAIQGLDLAASIVSILCFLPRDCFNAELVKVLKVNKVLECGFRRVCFFINLEEYSDCDPFWKLSCLIEVLDSELKLGVSIGWDADEYTAINRH